MNGNACNSEVRWPRPSLGWGRVPGLGWGRVTQAPTEACPPKAGRSREVPEPWGSWGEGGFHCQALVPLPSRTMQPFPTAPPPRPLQASPPAVCSATVTCCFRSTSHSVVQGLPWLLTDPWAFPILTLTTQYHDCLVTCTHQCPAHGLRFNNY